MPSITETKLIRDEPKISETEETLKQLYVLHYRQGNNPHPLQKYFLSDIKDFRQLVERAKKHCDTMNLRFVQVKPFLVNLAKEESVLLGDRN